jgi:hypothetical protein
MYDISHVWSWKRELCNKHTTQKYSKNKKNPVGFSVVGWVFCDHSVQQCVILLTASSLLNDGMMIRLLQFYWKSYHHSLIHCYYFHSIHPSIYQSIIHRRGHLRYGMMFVWKHDSSSHEFRDGIEIVLPEDMSYHVSAKM